MVRNFSSSFCRDFELRRLRSIVVSYRELRDIPTKSPLSVCWLFTWMKSSSFIRRGVCRTCRVAINGLPLRKQSAGVSISATGCASDARRQRHEGREEEPESRGSVGRVCVRILKRGTVCEVQFTHAFPLIQVNKSWGFTSPWMIESWLIWLHLENT